MDVNRRTNQSEPQRAENSEPLGTIGGLDVRCSDRSQPRVGYQAHDQARGAPFADGIERLENAVAIEFRKEML
jgi:hypothetical protein